MEANKIIPVEAFTLPTQNCIKRLLYYFAALGVLCLAGMPHTRAVDGYIKVTYERS